ncbi:MAG: NAD-dependent epimerase/dehydratase family protein [Proteobacteria bacterium]|jgi:3beta-hydroxy-Delta5-steroid dehydrogenase / steroid Delta-isomerase|nr:NAD-dependent epimerase/dehydratase family protein [Pseudomonadota bacterium]
MPPSFGSTCLVTGGAGYLGRHVVRELLDKGCAVHLLDRVPAFEEDDRVRNYVGDIRDYETVRAAVNGVDTVFHHASVINGPTSSPAHSGGGFRPQFWDFLR